MTTKGFTVVNARDEPQLKPNIELLAKARGVTKADLITMLVQEELERLTAAANRGEIAPAIKDFNARMEAAKAQTAYRGVTAFGSMGKSGKASPNLLFWWLEVCSRRDSNPSYRLERADEQTILESDNIMTFADLKHPLLSWVEDSIYNGGSQGETDP